MKESYWFSKDVEVTIVGKGDEVVDNFVNQDVALVLSDGDMTVVVEGNHLQLMTKLAAANAEIAQHLQDQRNQ